MPLKDLEEHGKKKEEEERMSSIKSVKAPDEPCYKEAENILEQAQQGESLDDNMIRWPDEPSGGFVIFLTARALEIAFSGNPKYWKWYPYIIFDVAELLGGCVLLVCGKLDMSQLVENVRYKVSFIVMMKDDSSGWDTPVSLVLRVGGAKIDDHDVELSKLCPNWPVEIVVGEFVATKTGIVEFYMIDRQCLITRKGLVIMGAVIRPAFLQQ